MTLLTLLKATSGGGGVTASIVGVTRTPSDGSDATGASLALTIPSGTAIDDYAVIIAELWDSTATNPTLTYPSGFTQIVNYVSTTDGFQKLKVAIKLLTAADSGTYSVSGFASHFRQGHVAILRGIDLTTALDVAVNLAQNSTGTALPTNSITTATNGCLLMHVIGNENTCTGLPATGYTEQADSNYTKTNTKIQTTAGTDSPSGGSFSASTLKLGALLAFRPAAGGGPTTHILTADGSSAATGSAAMSLRMVATASGSATPAGTAGLALRLPLNGSGSSTGAGSAALSLRLPLAATGASAAVGSAALSAKLAATASGAAAATGTADLTLSGVGPTTHPLTATGAGTAAGSAALRLRAALTAAGSATPGGSALLAGRLVMAATGGAASLGSAYLTALWLLTASGAASSSGSADLVIVGALPPITERPFAGLTSRPAGTPPVTAQPDSGTTSRPAGGPPTTRPYAGTTSRP